MSYFSAGIIILMGIILIGICLFFAWKTKKEKKELDELKLEKRKNIRNILMGYNGGVVHPNFGLCYNLSEFKARMWISDYGRYKKSLEMELRQKAKDLRMEILEEYWIDIDNNEVFIDGESLLERKILILNGQSLDDLQIFLN